MDIWIELDSMHFYAYHGVLEQERAVGNNYLVMLSVRAQLSQALQSDALADTINYAELYQAVKREMEIPSRLLEHVLGRILQAVFSYDERIEEIRLSVAKCPPPLGVDISASRVSTQITRQAYHKLTPTTSI